MSRLIIAVVTILVLSGNAGARRPRRKKPLPGTEEFGLSQKELVQSVEKVEALIAKCMREHGFEYVAADYATVRKAMVSDKKLPGIGEEEFVENYGFGISTFYSGKPPQLAEGYCPARVGLGIATWKFSKSFLPQTRLHTTAHCSAKIQMPRSRWPWRAKISHAVEAAR